MLLNKELRKRIAWMTWHSKEGHIPSAFSILDLIVLAYEKFLNINPQELESKNRDYFILSKGHGCSALYAYFEQIGILSETDIENKNKSNGILATHPDRNKVPGIEASTGSLGNGIGFALGIALGLKIENAQNKVLTILGDAECNEGTVWECALLAPHLKLDNFTIIIDNNHSCDPTLPVPNLPEKFRAFGWQVFEINGHVQKDIIECFESIKDTGSNGMPKCIIANTVKGKGVPNMENNYGHWHSKVPSDLELSEIMVAIDNY
jgi:transketolase